MAVMNYTYEEAQKNWEENPKAYCELWSDEYKKFVEDNNLKFDDESIKKFFVSERQAKKEYFPNRLDIVQYYRALSDFKEGKAVDNTKVQVVIRYFQIFNEDFRKYYEEHRKDFSRGGKRAYVAGFFADEMKKTRNQ